VIQETKEKTKNDNRIEWVTMNVAEPDGREKAVAYKLRFVPTTIINGETKLVGVTTVERLIEEIEKCK
jgi:hypothetical protein